MSSASPRRTEQTEIERKYDVHESAGVPDLVGAGGDGEPDALVVDAFEGPRVPASLATAEFLDEWAARRRPGGVFVANVTDRAPFGWARSFVAAVRGVHRSLLLSAEDYGPAEFCVVYSLGIDVTTADLEIT